MSGSPRLKHSEVFMMMSSNGNIIHVTGPLRGEFTGHRWIPLTNASNAELWRCLWSAPDRRLRKQSWSRWFETPSCSLWRHGVPTIDRLFNYAIGLLIFKYHHSKLSPVLDMFVKTVWFTNITPDNWIFFIYPIAGMHWVNAIKISSWYDMELYLSVCWCKHCYGRIQTSSEFIFVVNHSMDYHCFKSFSSELLRDLLIN